MTFSESVGLFDQFVQNMEINSVELYDSTGMLITLPTEQFYDSSGPKDLIVSKDLQIMPHFHSKSS